MNRQNVTRDRVLDVACRLFYSKGFNGTSVRDIANAANVNVSLIHYYFKSKQGLFESLAINYFEPYLEILESIHFTDANERVETLVRKILHYKLSHNQLSCLVYRELSLNTVFAREMLVTYLAKEDHLLSNILFHKSSKMEITFKEKLKVLQLKGLLNAPFTMPHEFRDPFITEASLSHFVEEYSQSMLEQEAVQKLAVKA